MSRKLFCEISPLAYRISVLKCRILKDMEDIFSHERFSRLKSETRLPYVVCRHKSLIRRRLGDVDMRLQENKAVNLALAAPKVSGILIKPGEVFSFWHLVGDTRSKKGYKEGLVISNGKTGKETGGGMCQLTNLIHWMVLHSNLSITEHHHHDGFDLFPDFNRQIPFGTGTSIFYNYLDYRFKNDTKATYQLYVYISGEYLCGELRSDRKPAVKYHINSEAEFFSMEHDGVYRNGIVKRRCVDIETGNTIFEETIRENHARVMYDASGIEISAHHRLSGQNEGR